MSPRRQVPSGRRLRAPPNSRQASAFFTSAWPKMLGAILAKSSSVARGEDANARNSSSSSGVKVGPDEERAPSESSTMPTTRRYGTCTAADARAPLPFFPPPLPLPPAAKVE